MAANRTYRLVYFCVLATQRRVFRWGDIAFEFDGLLIRWSVKRLLNGLSNYWQTRVHLATLDRIRTRPLFSVQSAAPESTIPATDRRIKAKTAGEIR